MKKYKSLQALFRDEKRWTKRVLYRGRNGRSCHDPKDAVSCCLIGGIEVVYNPSKSAKVIEKVNRYLGRRPHSLIDDWHVAAFNDAESTTIKDVRKLCRVLGI